MGQAFSGKLSLVRVCGKNGVCYYTTQVNESNQSQISFNYSQQHNQLSNQYPTQYH